MEKEIQKELFNLKDEKYKQFHCKLIPTVNPNRVIGVRAPLLKAYAQRLIKETSYNEFLKALPHYYYEENNLHAFIINQEKNYNQCIKMLESFLPYVDNWATCDGLRPKCFKKNKGKLLNDIDIWLSSKKTYTIRFGIEMLMTHFLDESFEPVYSQKISQIKSEQYYINMMISWYFATALAKQWDKTIPYIENKLLSPWIHNKTIQKAIESYRISNERKAYLKQLK